MPPDGEIPSEGYDSGGDPACRFRAGPVGRERTKAVRIAVAAYCILCPHRP